MTNNGLPASNRCMRSSKCSVKPQYKARLSKVKGMMGHSSGARAEAKMPEPAMKKGLRGRM